MQLAVENGFASALEGAHKLANETFAGLVASLCFAADCRDAMRAIPQDTLHCNITCEQSVRQAFEIADR